MIKRKNQTLRLFTSSEEEIIEKLVKEDHAFRKLNKIINFEKHLSPYYRLYSTTGAEGIDVVKGMKALLLQFWEDYSDREMEKALEENVAMKWFCGFGLLETTPTFSYFSKLRKRLGTKNIARLFNQINDELRAKGLFGDFFKFIDASSIITKTALWEERDKAIKNGEEKLNNHNVEKYASDKDARWGAKSKNKIWFGHKRHHTIDMKNGLIEKVAVTPGNVLDDKVLENICPRNCMIFADKLYDTNQVKQTLKIKGCHSGIIEKNNRKNRDKDLNSWRSKTRMPFEGSFSKLRKQAKFRGKTKVLMQCYLESICHNLKKAVVLLPA